MDIKRVISSLMLIALLTLPGIAVASQAFYLSSAPTGLNLSVIPKTLPANGQTYDALIVTAVIGSTPAEELSTLNLTLSSSNPSVISVPSSAAIEINTDSVQIPLTTSTTPGSASITVSAPNVVTESITVSTTALANVPTGFNAVATPSKLFFGQNTTGLISVSLVNSVGSVVATNTPVTFTLTTSSVNFSTSSQLVIPVGASMETTNFQIFNPGTYNIVVNSTLGSKTLTVTAVYYPPTAISAVMFPDVLGVGLSSELVMSLMNSNNVNMPALSPVTFTVTSSDNAVVSVNGQTVTLGAGGLNSIIGIYPNTAGKATITVSANGYPSVSIPVTVLPLGSAPTAMKVVSSQPSFALSTGTSQGLGIELLDSSGRPVSATSAVQVTLSSSNPALLGSFSQSVTIPVGSYFISIPVYFGPTPGSTTVTASAQNFPAATAAISSKGYVPTRLASTVLFSKASTGVYRQVAAFYLTDNNGLAYDSLSSVSLQGSVSGTSVSLMSPTMVFQPGDDLLLSSVNVTRAGPSTITYTSSLGSASYTVSGEVITGGLSVSIPSINPLVGQPYMVAVSYVSGGSYVYNSNDITGQLASSVTSVVSTAQLDIPAGASIAYIQLQPETAGKVALNTVASGYTSVGTTLTVDSTPYTMSVSTPSIMYVGQVSHIYVQIDQNSLPVKGLTVTGSAAHGEKILCTSTNSTGYAACTYTGTDLSDILTFSIKGVATTASLPVTLITNGNTQHNASPGIPIGPVAVVVFIVIILLVAIMMFRRKHKSGGSSIAEEEVARLEEEANKTDQPAAQKTDAPAITPSFESPTSTPPVTPESDANKLPLVKIDEEKDDSVSQS